MFLLKLGAFLESITVYFPFQPLYGHLLALSAAHPGVLCACAGPPPGALLSLRRACYAWTQAEYAVLNPDGHAHWPQTDPPDGRIGRGQETF